MLDATRSMEIFAQTTKKILQQLIDICELINSEINIVIYRDKDVKINALEHTFNMQTNIEKINFVSEILTHGGMGDNGEMIKSAYSCILDNIDKDAIIINLTDSPPHNLETLQFGYKRNDVFKQAINAKLEKEELDKKPWKWDLMSIYKEMSKRNFIITTIISPERYYINNKIYTYSLNTISYARLVGNVIKLASMDSDDIIKVIITIILQIFGQKTEISINCIEEYINKPEAEQISKAFQDLLKEKYEIKKNYIFKNINSNIIKKLTKDFDIDNEYKNLVYKLIEKYFEPTNIIILTYNTLFSFLWRKICKNHEDTRTIRLRSKFDNCMKLLKKNNIQLANIVDKWNLESFDNSLNIYEIITECENPLKKGIMVLDTKDKTITLEDLRTLLVNPYAKLLEKMNFISEVRIIKTGKLPFDEKNNPLYIPIELPNIFHIIPSLFVKGFEYNLKGAAIIAILYILSGHPSMHEYADKFLISIKGKFIPDISKYKEYTEILNNNFIQLIYKANKYLTQDEKFLYENFKKILDIKKIKSLSINIEIGRDPQVDIPERDYKKECNFCKKYRSFTKMINNKCGDCTYSLENGINTKSLGKDLSYTTRCSECNRIYTIENPSKDCKNFKKYPIVYRCHGCISKKKIEDVTCKACFNVFLCPSKNKDKDYSDFICAECKYNEKSLITKSIKLDVLIKYNEEIFANLFGINIDMLRDIFYNDLTIYNLYDKYKERLHINYSSRTIGTVDSTFKWKFKKIINYEKIFDFIIDNLINENFIKTCDLCYSEYEINKLYSACGYNNCINNACNDCLTKLYNQNQKKGNLYIEIFCPFCKRKPQNNIISLYNRDSLNVDGRSKKKDIKYYYGWCIECNKIKQLAEKICSEDLPIINNFQCEECIEEISKAHIKKIKAKTCPGPCEMTIEKISGCNHITCPQCKIHWCWLCNKIFSNADIYRHINITHGDGALFRND
jgi:hypothetical protein